MNAFQHTVYQLVDLHVYKYIAPVACQNLLLPKELNRHILDLRNWYIYPQGIFESLCAQAGCLYIAFPQKVSMGHILHFDNIPPLLPVQGDLDLEHHIRYIHFINGKSALSDAV